ncbi:MAG TPA: hypothetical protein DCZ44_05445 [Flavobacteriaceae bacterium]|nr:hypothetical protein [Flavobacteriaceae bacterium]
MKIQNPLGVQTKKALNPFGNKAFKGFCDRARIIRLHSMILIRSKFREQNLRFTIVTSFSVLSPLLNYRSDMVLKQKKPTATQ